ncbi:MAG: hypothetical protein HXS44_09730 [Theionarchaea archaeon]|nr:hypothetical protein [Theionarchaea archaeon]
MKNLLRNKGSIRKLIAFLVAASMILFAGAVCAQESESPELQQPTETPQTPEPAQSPESQDIKTVQLFTWAASDPPQWYLGILYAFLGLIGSLVTIYSLIGASLPGIAGQVRIDVNENRLENMSKQLEELVGESPLEAEAIKEIGTVVNDLRKDLWKERWRQFGIAAILYALVGASFSVLLAQDLLQALVIGASWTGLLGTLGLKKDYEERKNVKDIELLEALKRIKELEDKLKKLLEKGVSRQGKDISEEKRLAGETSPLENRIMRAKSL